MREEGREGEREGRKREEGREEEREGRRREEGREGGRGGREGRGREGGEKDAASGALTQSLWAVTVFRQPLRRSDMSQSLIVPSLLLLNSRAEWARRDQMVPL